MSQIRGRCYDGASVITGVKSGVVARVKAAEPKSCVHSLLWACTKFNMCRYLRLCKLMQDALDTTHEIIKLINKKSPRHESMFKRLKEEIACDGSGI